MKSIKYIFYLSAFGFFFCSQVFAQQDLQMLERPVRISGEHMLEEFHVTERKLKRQELNLEYHWYQNNRIFKTYGSSSGRLLHGTYRSFYPGAELLQKGEFKMGLKQGQWITWFPSGIISRLEHYKNGQFHGIFKEYDSGGFLNLQADYINGRLHGKVFYYENGELSAIERYVNGQLIPEKEEESKKRNFRLPRREKKEDKPENVHE